MKKNTNLLKVADRKKFFKDLALSKKRNYESNMAFIRLYAEWIKRASNKEWSKRRKLLIDEVYKTNRRLRLNSAHN
ncbi:hypothetical protein M1141_00110 [Candidatus Marsarchaeota archaeon]|jgi:hypothetical protein|nr:hypothetical protein [Candidatus Marsarchaeota archaeon]